MAAAVYGSALDQLSLQLIDGVTDRHLWASTYERETRRVLALQGLAARGIAEGIRLRLEPEADAGKQRTGASISPEAHDAYLRGLFFMDTVSREGMSQAINHFRRSVDAEPGYAPAYVGLADVYNRSAIRGYLPPREAYPLAKAAVSRAIQLDETLAEAHAVEGVIKFRWEWDWQGAERELRRALELSPNTSRVRLGYGTYLLMKGRFSEAVTEGHRALELDPLSPQRHVDLVQKLQYANQYDEAVKILTKTFELAPNFVPAFRARAATLAAQGRYVQAAADCERALPLAPEEQLLLTECGVVYTRAGRRHEGMRLLDKIKQLSTMYIDPYQVAFCSTRSENLTRRCSGSIGRTMNGRQTWASLESTCIQRGCPSRAILQIFSDVLISYRS